MRPAVQQTLKELERFQCGSGGFAYWPGACETVSPYLTAYLLHVFKTAADLKYDVDRGVRERAYDYLRAGAGAEPPPANESWWPAYTAWQAFAVKVLVEGGRNQDSNINRLYGYRDRMPVFALAYLHDALLAKGETAASRVTDLRRRMTNAILPEAGSAHVEELADPYLLWFWNSNVRSTAIVLNTLVKAGAGRRRRSQPMVRWLMGVRKNGRWGNTQENAYAMEALVSYYRKYEPDVPELPRGRDARRAGAGARRVPGALDRRQRRSRCRWRRCCAAGPARRPRPLTFTREGAGTLFYTARLRYAADALLPAGARHRLPHRAALRAVRRERHAARRDQLQRRRSRPRHADVPPDEGAPLRGRDRSAAGRLRGGRVVVRDDGAVARRRRRTSQTSAGRPTRRLAELVALRRVRPRRAPRRSRPALRHAPRAKATHKFSYIVRATTAGTFRTAPARAEEMYEPEVFGRTATTMIEVKR